MALRIALVSVARTPVGSFGGVFRDVTATQLGAAAAAEAVKRAGIDPAIIDEVIFGSGGQPIKEANVARQVSLFAAFPQHIPAYSVQRNCAASLEAVASAGRAILAGEGDTYVVGGAENMSQAPYMSYQTRWGARLRHVALEDSLWAGLTDQYTGLLMGETAENLVDRYGLTRRDQDEVAVRSHERAFKAIHMGKFREEIVPVTVPSKRGGEPEVVVQDEGPMAGLSLERLAMAPPVFKKGGTVTPGNSCPMNDAGSAAVLMSERKLSELGLKPLGWVKSWGFAGVDPAYMGLGPAASTPVALRRAGLAMKDIGLVEINEAFAAQYLACQRELGFSDENANVNGGGIALGHPIGATGLRLVATLIHEMRRRGVKYGLATMCVGGGQGGSVIVELAE